MSHGSIDPSDLSYTAFGAAQVTHAEVLRRLSGTDPRLARAFRSGIFGMDPGRRRFELTYLTGDDDRRAREHEGKLRAALGESCPLPCAGWELRILGPESREARGLARQIHDDTRRRLDEGAGGELFDPNRLEPTAGFGCEPPKGETAALLADTETIERLNCEAGAFDRGFVLSGEGVERLDPLGEHVGVPLVLTPDKSEVFVAWLLRTVDDGEGPGVLGLIASPPAAIAELPTTRVPDSLAREAVERAKDYLTGLQGEHRRGQSGSD